MNVLIVGGGVIGLTTAYFLAREGVRVRLIDQGDLGQESSWAGAGMLTPGSSQHARTPFDVLRGHSYEAFPRLSEELRERTGIDNGFRRCGGLDFIEVEGRACAEEWRGEGVEAETLDDNAVCRLEPNLATGLGSAVYLPGLAQLRNPRHLRALIVAGQQLGVEFNVCCPALGFMLERGGVSGLRTPAGILHADRYLVATGSWTNALLEPLGWSPGIVPIRGQIALLQTSGNLLSRVILWGERYLVPRPDGRVLVGSTEENVGFDKRPTAAVIGELLQAAVRLVPRLADAMVERSWAGLRPHSPTGLPYLGSVPGHGNVFVSAGHFRSGIQLSPASAQVMVEMILGRTTTFAIEAYRLAATR